ncbi:VWA domain-containing protein [Desulfoprunum benzoelyticum]|uniref:Nitric oxide reductase NorD protein n=1 Tax=Desulfoprunum benzoelyticum TaxID=1506996 RepID=A0A840URQ9_9BACT|nr:VWA domain-containing protein [Desulfoprunum benzoelyticum]MBB5348907.1 nitric oxide reductase NorD protein [Desulfoprunum benzoelyticum]MBM9530143.1 VWA domain-containing protein [Desulfoprunum benzoelyticum]
MDLDAQKQAFYELVSPSRPNDWEVEEVMELLAGIPADYRRALLAHVPTIWPISHSLCFSFLGEGVKGASRCPPELLSEWVRQILSRYEESGLRAARDFMGDIDTNFLQPLHGNAGVAVDAIRGAMVPYLRGVSGLALDLAADGQGRLWTDTRTIFVPGRQRLFAERVDNLLFLRFTVILQWGYIAGGSFRRQPDGRDFAALAARYGTGAGEGAIDAYLSCFPDPARAGQLLLLFELPRVFDLIRRELPGLVRAVQPLCQRLLAEDQGRCGRRGDQVHDLLRSILLPPDPPPPVGDHRLQGDGESGALSRFPDFYDRLADGRAGADHVLTLLVGEPDFIAARKRIEQTRAEDREQFISRLAGVLEQTRAQGPAGEKGPGGAGRADSIVLTAQGGDRHGEQEEAPGLSLLAEIELPPDLAAVRQRIEADLGEVPASYIQAAAGMAGQGRNLASGPETDGQIVPPAASFVYDEWDYRRAGYRKDWCVLVEKELPAVMTDFVPLTLHKYRGLKTRVRRQFEMLRTAHRFVKRRRYGDDIDFDAMVDALGDRQAGFAPSDRLFIRLVRDHRDIAALFLVDMSNSTEGWVGRMIKEALVLLCEVMEVSGDRYGIYGFSGMRRSRCELFHVKHLHEVYGEEVRQRIGAIGPREYTRMGPPIRHLTRMLQGTDARLRLLITLSDGKPEDYDGYVDVYAIEDTRKALVEARGAGIHSFCITVDQTAQDYLAHMYGRGNYIFVNKIENLPRRMTEFYRLLTS